MNNIQEVEILLVEDNPNDRELTLRALKENNMANHIHVVADGAEALDFLFAKGQYKDREISNPPKIVLLDLKLPKVSGLEVLEKIRSHPNTRMIPVAVLTSSKEESDIKKCYRLGVNSYIVKPVEFHEFKKVVSKLGMYWLIMNQPPQEV